MALNDLEDQILEHLENLIMRGLVYIYPELLKRNITSGTPPQVPEFKIILGEKTISAHFPIIRISSQNAVQNEWLASGVRHDQYFCNVDVEMRSSRKEAQDKAIMAMSNSIKNWLLHRPNLSGSIFNSNATYYNSWCQQTAMGVSGDGSIRTARFTWACDVANSYFYNYSEA